MAILTDQTVSTKHTNKISSDTEHCLCMQEKAKWSEETNNDVGKDGTLAYLPDSLDICSESWTKTAVKQGGDEKKKKEGVLQAEDEAMSHDCRIPADGELYRLKDNGDCESRQWSKTQQYKM